MLKSHTYETGSTSITPSVGITLVALNSWLGDALPVLSLSWHHPCLHDTSGSEVFSLKCAVSSVIHMLLIGHRVRPSFLRHPSPSLVRLGSSLLWPQNHCICFQLNHDHRKKKIKAMHYLIINIWIVTRQKRDGKWLLEWDLQIILVFHISCLDFLQNKGWCASFRCMASLMPYCLHWSPCSATAQLCDLGQVI